jgi:hypothetical protein
MIKRKRTVRILTLTLCLLGSLSAIGQSSLTDWLMDPVEMWRGQAPQNIGTEPTYGNGPEYFELAEVGEANYSSPINRTSIKIDDVTGNAIGPVETEPRIHANPAESLSESCTKNGANCNLANKAVLGGGDVSSFTDWLMSLVDMCRGQSPQNIGTDPAFGDGVNYFEMTNMGEGTNIPGLINRRGGTKGRVQTQPEIHADPAKNLPKSFTKNGTTCTLANKTLLKSVGGATLAGVVSVATYIIQLPLPPGVPLPPPPPLPPIGFPGLPGLGDDMAQVSFKEFQLTSPVNLVTGLKLDQNYSLSSLNSTSFGILSTPLMDATDKWGRLELTIPSDGIFYVAAQASSIPSGWTATQLQELFTATAEGKQDKAFSLYKVTAEVGSQVTFKTTANGPLLVSDNLKGLGDLIPDQISLQLRNLYVDDVLVDETLTDPLDIKTVSKDFPGRYARLVSASATGLTSVTVPESGDIFIVATTQKATELQAAAFTLEDKGEIMTTEDAKVFHLYKIIQRGGANLVTGGKCTLLVDGDGPFIASDVLDTQESATHCGNQVPCSSQ